ncbi:MAG: agmatinase [Candidatus Bathyarchaeota archaeon]|jgi:agmatinase
MDNLLRPVLQTLFETVTPLEKAQYAIFGAPLDITATHRAGYRFAPTAIRQASLYMESYSTRTGLNHRDIAMADAGDITGLDSVESLTKIEEAIHMLTKKRKIPVMMGGEHTVTLGALRALQPDLVLCFDAHLDLRDTLFGERLSHGTFMRRALEESDFKLVTIGARALSKEEWDFTEDNPGRVKVVTATDIRKGGIKAAVETMRDWIEDSPTIYISVDMDVIDPAAAPGVGNPAPEGLTPTTLLDLISSCSSRSVTGIDLTEVTPNYDSGRTATLAAYLLIESLYSLKKSGN